MRSRTLALLALVVLGIGLAAGPAAAQAGRGTGRISGTVKDEAGNAVAGAKITIVLLNSEAVVKREALTDKKGEWAIIGLGTSQWTLKAEAAGYAPTTVDIQVKQLDRNAAVNVVLKKAVAGKAAVADEATLVTIEKANQLFEERNYDGAMILFQEVEAANPDVYQVRMSIGDCLREKGEIDRALEAYSTVLEKAQADPENGKDMSAKALARIGECWLKKGDLEKAQGFFKQSIDISPEDELLAYNVGEIYFSNQKLDEAITYFALAAKIKPDWSEAYYKLGLAYLNKADYAKARESLRKVLELEPEGERAVVVKGILEAIAKL